MNRNYCIRSKNCDEIKVEDFLKKKAISGGSEVWFFKTKDFSYIVSATSHILSEVNEKFPNLFLDSYPIPDLSSVIELLYSNSDKQHPI